MGQNLRAKILWAKILRAEISWAEISWAKILKAKFLQAKNMEIFKIYFILKLAEIWPKKYFFGQKKTKSAVVI